MDIIALAGVPTEDLSNNVSIQMIITTLIQVLFCRLIIVVLRHSTGLRTINLLMVFSFILLLPPLLLFPQLLRLVLHRLLFPQLQLPLLHPYRQLRLPPAERILIAVIVLVLLLVLAGGLGLPVKQEQMLALEEHIGIGIIVRQINVMFLQPLLPRLLLLAV